MIFFNNNMSPYVIVNRKRYMLADKYFSKTVTLGLGKKSEEWTIEPKNQTNNESKH